MSYNMDIKIKIGGVLMTDKNLEITKQPERQQPTLITPVVDINDIACSPEFSDSCKSIEDDE